MQPGTQPKAYPAFVVGVAQRDLFWKDIRRVLFSQAQYTVFCRLAISGLVDKWHPVKVADVLAGIVPQFDELITKFSERAGQAMTVSANVSPIPVGQNKDPGTEIIKTYAELLATHHGSTLNPDVIQSISPEHDWLSTVDGRRPVFAEVTQCVDKTLGVETSSEVAHDLRVSAMRNTGLASAQAPQASSGSGHDVVKVSSGQERFLDAEIIAIYW